MFGIKKYARKIVARYFMLNYNKDEALIKPLPSLMLSLLHLWFIIDQEHAKREANFNNLKNW